MEPHPELLYQLLIQRRDELIHEADLARLASRAHQDRPGWRQRLGRRLVSMGTRVGGPTVAEPRAVCT